MSGKSRQADTGDVPELHIIKEKPDNRLDQLNLERFTLRQADYGTAQAGKDTGPIRRITDFIFRKSKQIYWNPKPKAHSWSNVTMEGVLLDMNDNRSAFRIKVDKVINLQVMMNNDAEQGVWIQSPAAWYHLVSPPAPEFSKETGIDHYLRKCEMASAVYGVAAGLYAEQAREQKTSKGRGSRKKSRIEPLLLSNLLELAKQHCGLQMTEDSPDALREEHEFIYRQVNDALKDYTRGPNVINNDVYPVQAKERPKAESRHQGEEDRQEDAEEEAEEEEEEEEEYTLEEEEEEGDEEEELKDLVDEAEEEEELVVEAEEEEEEEEEEGRRAGLGGRDGGRGRGRAGRGKGKEREGKTGGRGRGRGGGKGKQLKRVRRVADTDSESEKDGWYTGSSDDQADDQGSVSSSAMDVPASPPRAESKGRKRSWFEVGGQEQAAGAHEVKRWRADLLRWRTEACVLSAQDLSPDLMHFCFRGGGPGAGGDGAMRGKDVRRGLHLLLLAADNRDAAMARRFRALGGRQGLCKWLWQTCRSLQAAQTILCKDRRERERKEGRRARAWVATQLQCVHAILTLLATPHCLSLSPSDWDAKADVCGAIVCWSVNVLLSIEASGTAKRDDVRAPLRLARALVRSFSLSIEGEHTMHWLRHRRAKAPIWNGSCPLLPGCVPQAMPADDDDGAHLVAPVTPRPRMPLHVQEEEEEEEEEELVVPMEEAEVGQGPLTPLETVEEEVEVEDLTLEDDGAMDVHVHVEEGEGEGQEKEKETGEEEEGRVDARGSVTVIAEVDTACGEEQLDAAEFTSLEDCRVQ